MSVLQSLLLIDADERSRTALGRAFERAGATVLATSDPDEGVALAGTRRPDLVVVGSSSGGVDALLLVTTLRAGGATATLPVVVVGDAERREAVLDAGADEFAARPVHASDVVTLGRLAVAMRDSDAEHEGELADFGLYALTRALSSARRSAVLFLERERRSGDLRLRDGELVSARVGRQTGANAFLHLLLWESARIHLRYGEPGTPQKIHKPMERLLEDGTRFVAEFESIAAKVGGAGSVYRLDKARRDEMRRQIPAEVLPLADSYDGQRTLIDIVEDSPFKPFDTIMITFRLAEMRVIARSSDAAPSRRAPALVDEDDVIEAGPDGEVTTRGGRAPSEAAKPGGAADGAVAATAGGAATGAEAAKAGGAPRAGGATTTGAPKAGDEAGRGSRKDAPAWAVELARGSGGHPAAATANAGRSANRSKGGAEDVPTTAGRGGALADAAGDAARAKEHEASGSPGDRPHTATSISARDAATVTGGSIPATGPSGDAGAATASGGQGGGAAKRAGEEAPANGARGGAAAGSERTGAAGPGGSVPVGSNAPRTPASDDKRGAPATSAHLNVHGAAAGSAKRAKGGKGAPPSTRGKGARRPTSPESVPSVDARPRRRDADPDATVLLPRVDIDPDAPPVPPGEIAPVPSPRGVAVRPGATGRSAGADAANAAAAGRGDTARHGRVSFDDLDEEFFAREAELFRVSEVESFEDLDATGQPPAPAPEVRRGWFGFGRKTPPSAPSSKARAPGKK